MFEEPAIFKSWFERLDWLAAIGVANHRLLTGVGLLVEPAGGDLVRGRIQEKWGISLELGPGRKDHRTKEGNDREYCIQNEEVHPVIFL